MQVSQRWCSIGSFIAHELVVRKYAFTSSDSIYMFPSKGSDTALNAFPFGLKLFIEFIISHVNVLEYMEYSMAAVLLMLYSI